MTWAEAFNNIGVALIVCGMFLGIMWLAYRAGEDGKGKQ